MLVQGFWRDRRTLVTGAMGLLGSWLVRALADAGAEAVALRRDQVPFVPARTTIVDGDVTDQALLEACRRSTRVAQVVVASSDKAYGDQPVLPYTEATPLAGRHPYDVSKACADLIAQAYAASYGTRVAITRCGNLFGGGDLHWNRLVPGTVRSVLRGERPVIRSDGTFVRDYFYVEDGVAAYMALAEGLAADPGLAGQAFNFAYGEPLAVRPLVDRILAVMGSDLEPLVLNEATGEIRAQHLDSTRAREVLGWAPRFTLEEGLAHTVEWYREHLA